MGLLRRLSSVMGSDAGDPFATEYRGYVPPSWYASLSSAGVAVTPELAMCLSAFYSGVTAIAYDLATLPCQIFKYRDDGGKDRVRPSAFGLASGGIGGLAYRLRWQPNSWQTMTEFTVAMIVQFLSRGKCYAEIVGGGAGNISEQLLPRHPDRVEPQRLPNGNIRYRLTEADGSPRYLLQDEMFVVRDLSLDGIYAPSRVQYGAQAIGTALATQRAAGKFFKSGMTASVVATYKGEMDDEDEADLHGSISRYAAGVENSFGLLLVPDNVTLSNLGVEPEKAQMMLAQEWGVREVARMLHMPGSKLGIKDSVAYNSQIQDAVSYVIGCLRPIAHNFEQSIQRDLIIAKDSYFAEFLIDALLRGDPQARAEYFSEAIEYRWMWPSEVRVIENMNPDPRLDALAEQDRRAGSSNKNGGQQNGNGDRNAVVRPQFRGMLAVYDNAVRCLRRERVAVEKLAKKHASDVDGWKAALRDFYTDHARFVAETMRVSHEVARDYAAQHGSEFEARGVVIIEGEAGTEWERFEASELAALALEPETRAA